MGRKRRFGDPRGCRTVMESCAADIGGSHARFALADVEDGQHDANGRSVHIQRPSSTRACTPRGKASASNWAGLCPAAAAIAVACPITGEMLKLTNNPWIIRPAMIAERLGVDRFTLINDFGAIGHAVARVGQEHLRHLCGPDIPLPDEGVISIIGPGSGLGMAHLLRRGGHDHVIECEGGHIDYAPVDEIEDLILARLRERFGRVSVERVVSGPGLANIYEVLASVEGRAVRTGNDKELWTAALSGDRQPGGRGARPPLPDSRNDRR